MRQRAGALCRGLLWPGEHTVPWVGSMGWFKVPLMALPFLSYPQNQRCIVPGPGNVPGQAAFTAWSGIVACSAGCICGGYPVLPCSVNTLGGIA